MVLPILLVLMIRIQSESSSVFAQANPLRSFPNLSTLKFVRIQLFDKQPGLFRSPTTEFESPAQSLISILQPTLLSLFTAILLGFYIGNRKKPHSATSQIASPIKPSNHSKASTMTSFIQSPNALSSTLKNFSFPDSPPQSSLDDLIDTGNFSKYFIEKSVIFTSEKFNLLLAEHKLDAQLYLIKKMPMQLSLVEDFKKQDLFLEISKVKKLCCRHITRYVTCWVESNGEKVEGNDAEVMLYVQIEYIEGESLLDRVKTGISENLCVKIARNISKALWYIQSEGLQHGRISVDNIFINQYDWITIGDFDFSASHSNDIQGLLNVVTSLIITLPITSQAQTIAAILQIPCMKSLGINSINLV